MSIPSRLDSFRLGRCARFSVCPDIVSGKGVGSFDTIFQVGRELARAQRGTILDTYVMLEKQRQIGGDNRLPGRFALGQDIEAKRAGILQLIEAEIPQLHCRPWQGPDPAS